MCEKVCVSWPGVLAPSFRRSWLEPRQFLHNSPIANLPKCSSICHGDSIPVFEKRERERETRRELLNERKAHIPRRQRVPTFSLWDRKPEATLGTGEIHQTARFLAKNTEYTAQWMGVGSSGSNVTYLWKLVRWVWRPQQARTYRLRQ